MSCITPISYTCAETQCEKYGGQRHGMVGGVPPSALQRYKKGKKQTQRWMFGVIKWVPVPAIYLCWNSVLKVWGGRRVAFHFQHYQDQGKSHLWSSGSSSLLLVRTLGSLCAGVQKRERDVTCKFVSVTKLWPSWTKNSASTARNSMLCNKCMVAACEGMATTKWWIKWLTQACPNNCTVIHLNYPSRAKTLLRWYHNFLVDGCPQVTCGSVLR